jgi:hypothetical protein
MGSQRRQRRKGGTRKHGRDKERCARYRALGRREENKERKIQKEKRRQERLKARKAKRMASDPTTQNPQE